MYQSISRNANPGWQHLFVALQDSLTDEATVCCRKQGGDVMGMTSCVAMKGISYMSILVVCR